MNELVPNRASTNGDQPLATQPKPEPPAASSSPRTLTAEQQVVMDKIQFKADIVRDIAFPAAMASALPVSNDIGVPAFKLYRDGLMRDAGSPTDPIEIMMIEQISLAHHRVAQLHVQAERSKSIDEAKIFTMAAWRLTGEFRRLALALNQYRQPTPKRSFTLIRQQNVSRAGQQVAYLDQSNESRARIPCDQTAAKLTSKQALRLGSDPDPHADKPSEQPGLTPTG